MYIFYFNCYYFIPSFSFKYTVVFSKTIIESVSTNSDLKAYQSFHGIIKKNHPEQLRPNYFRFQKYFFCV